jgi:hypothetical protein
MKGSYLAAFNIGSLAHDPTCRTSRVGKLHPTEHSQLREHFGPSLYGVSPAPQECSGTKQADERKAKVQLNDRPNPQASQRRGTLHHRQVSMRVRDVDKVATSQDAGGEKYGLPQRILEAHRQSGQQSRARRMRVEGVEEEKEHWQENIVRNGWRSIRSGRREPYLEMPGRFGRQSQPT